MKPKSTTGVLRRSLRLSTLDEILQDAEAITAGPHHTTADWTAAQNIWHVTFLIDGAVNGIPIRMPFFVPWVMRLVMKRRALARGFPTGLQPPAVLRKRVKPIMPPADVTLEDALAYLRSSVAAASKPGAMTHPSPVFGPMTHAQWLQFHCRHAELHFSFIQEGAHADGHQDAPA